MEQIAFRTEAAAHLAAARQLIASDTSDGLRYACLELRMSIEALAYDLFQRYYAEIGATAVNAWTPKQVMRELKYIDPEVEEDRTITIVLPAKNDQPERRIELGDEHRMSSSWADEAYNALGSFLHLPTLKQRNSAKFASRSGKIYSKAGQIILELENVLASRITGFRAHQLVKLKCDCGVLFARDLSFLKAGKDVTCSGCGRQMAYWWDDDVGAYAFTSRKADWKCPDCGQQHSMPLHHLKAGMSLTCTGCGEHFETFSALHLKRLGEDSPSDLRTTPAR